MEKKTLIDLFQFSFNELKKIGMNENEICKLIGITKQAEKKKIEVLKEELQKKEPHSCENCGKLHQQNTTWQRFCCDNCRAIWNKNN